MSRGLDNIINDLLVLIWNKKEGINRDSCMIYLRSICQKHLFAERRLATLQRKITNYKQKVEAKQHDGGITYPAMLNIEMDFDHCIVSLRSSLEHLAQLINAIVALGLSPKIIKGQTHVTLQNVAHEIENIGLSKSIMCLHKLSSFLKCEMNKEWYKELHDLRITMFHDMFPRFVRTSTQTVNHRLLDLKFLLPDGTAQSLVGEEKREITSYCRYVTSKVEDVLKESFGLLSEYLMIT